ncbi:VWCE protein, partial [Atractosteus spatula]|nr:VWCE protein [Atractosteus spatula]
MHALRCLCLCVLLSRADCRVLPSARRRGQRPYSPLLLRHRSGPHVCHSGGSTVCCPGWAPSTVSGLCVKPVCALGCGSGLCVAPNVCLCHGGKKELTCEGEGLAGDFMSDDLADSSQEGNHGGSHTSCLSAGCEHSCVLIGGFPICSCSHGYSLAKDGRSCQDVDECSRFGGASLCQQVCRNTMGSFRCHCYHGYQLSANGRSCVTVAVTTSQEGCGQYGCELKCNEGGCELVSRVCPVGFSMTETASGVTCTDIDECSESWSPCQQQCLNTAGSYQCSCRPGFYLHRNGRTCRDVDECSSSTRCHQRCINTVGSFHCACRRGYRYSTQRHTCTDIDECQRLPPPCQHQCLNVVGSFRCSCAEGFRLLSGGLHCEGLPDPVGSTTIQEIPRLLLKKIGTSAPESTEPLLKYSTSTFPATKPSSLMSYSAPSNFQLYPTSCPLYIYKEDINAFTHLSLQSFVSIPLQPSSQNSIPFIGGDYDAEPHIHPSAATGEQLMRAAPLDPPPTDVAAPALTLSSTGAPLTPPLPSLSLSPALTTPLGSGIALIPAPLPILTAVLCLHQGTQYSEGSSWVDADCNNCTCLKGSVICHDVTCTVSCTHPAWDPDQCCPTCKRCLYQGLVLEDEHTFSPENDSCTLCLCLVGNVTCLSPVCPPVSCAQPVLSECCPLCPVQCMYLGQEYPEGSEFSSPGDSCATCVCLNGRVDCFYPPCPTLDCPLEDWLREGGNCCPTCAQTQKREGCSVDDNGLEFPVGQIWSPGDPCETCVCQAAGKVVCHWTECIESCSHPIRVPGQCCPDCSMGCSYRGVVYEINESFLSQSNPCLTCICLAGSVACSPVHCQPNCTYPFHQEGQCCPLCQDCNYEGRKVGNGQTFSLENQPCIHCICQFGEVTCEEVSCTVTCSHPYPLLGECCPTCTGKKISYNHHQST